jgi:4'-phosphopantetheinyl transferase EntD
LSADLVTVGVDAEPHEALPPDVLGTISLPEERVSLARLAAARPQIHWDRLLFSAKEAVYKSWFPLTRRWLGFEEASVVFDPGPGPDLDPGPDAGRPGSFYARLLVPGPVVAGVSLSGFAGRWMVRDGLLFTAIALTTGNQSAVGQTASAERTIVL